MEIIDDRPQRERSCNRLQIASARNIYLGLALIAAGTLWILYNFHLVGHRFFDHVFSWQTLLIVLGGYLLSMRKWIGGAVLMVIGVGFGVVDWFHLCLPVNKVILPFIVIAAGVAVILRRDRN